MTEVASLYLYQAKQQSSAAYTGVDSYPRVATFQCTVKQLQELVAVRGAAAYNKLQDEYQGVHELSRRLRTSPTDGESRPDTWVQRY